MITNQERIFRKKLKVKNAKNFFKKINKKKIKAKKLKNFFNKFTYNIQHFFQIALRRKISMFIIAFLQQKFENPYKAFDESIAFELQHQHSRAFSLLKIKEFIYDENRPLLFVIEKLDKSIKTIQFIHIAFF